MGPERPSPVSQKIESSALLFRAAEPRSRATFGAAASSASAPLVSEREQLPSLRSESRVQRVGLELRRGPCAAREAAPKNCDSRCRGSSDGFTTLGVLEIVCLPLLVFRVRRAQRAERQRFPGVRGNLASRPSEGENDSE